MQEAGRAAPGKSQHYVQKIATSNLGNVILRVISGYRRVANGRPPSSAPRSTHVGGHQAPWRLERSSSRTARARWPPPGTDTGGRHGAEAGGEGAPTEHPETRPAPLPTPRGGARQGAARRPAAWTGCASIRAVLGQPRRACGFPAVLPPPQRAARRPGTLSRAAALCSQTPPEQPKYRTPVWEAFVPGRTGQRAQRRHRGWRGELRGTPGWSLRCGSRQRALPRAPLFLHPHRAPPARPLSLGGSPSDLAVPGHPPKQRAAAAELGQRLKAQASRPRSDPSPGLEDVPLQ